MNELTTEINKHRSTLRKMEAKSEALLIGILNETDFDKHIKLTREYNNLVARKEALEKYLNPDKKIKPEHVSVVRIKSVQTKRCG